MMYRIRISAIIAGLLLGVAALQHPQAQEQEPPPVPEIDISAQDVLSFLDYDADALYRAAWSAHSGMDYETAARYYIALLNQDAGNQSALYNLGCCYGMLGNAEMAAQCLQSAADAGFRNLWQLEHDPEFDPVRESEEYVLAVAEIEAGIEEQDLKQGELLFVESPTYLQCRVQFPDDYDPHKEYVLLVGLHGYGSYPTRFINLWDRFNEHDFIYAVPQAPYAFNSGLDDPGFSWGWWTDTHSLPANSWFASVDYVTQVIDQLQNSYSISDTYVLGFSQGAAMSYFVGMDNSVAISGIIPFGGWLDYKTIGESVIADNSETLRVFIAHGTSDTMVEYSSGTEARDLLEQWGYDVVFHEFDGGHSVPEEVLQIAEEWMKNPPPEDTK